MVLTRGGEKVKEEAAIGGKESQEKVTWWQKQRLESFTLRWMKVEPQAKECRPTAEDEKDKEAGFLLELPGGISPANI